MPVTVRFYTDPACPWSWAAEPALRRLMWEFEGELEFAWVMGGLARRYGTEYADFQCPIVPGGDCFAGLISGWLGIAAKTGMPHDPRIWTQNPLDSTYPACQAVKAACEQGWEAGYRYLRRVREGIMFGRRKLDHLEALVAEAGPAGLDRERFEIDVRSNAITESFANDLDEVRDPPREAREAEAVGETEGKERVSFPSAVFVGEDSGQQTPEDGGQQTHEDGAQHTAGDGVRHGVWGSAPVAAYREAALAAGAEQRNEGALEPLEAIRRFGLCATVELQELSGRPRPVVEAELWSLAKEWKLKPVEALTGTLWELPWAGSGAFLSLSERKAPEAGNERSD